jgi:hypothetical protein
MGASSAGKGRELHLQLMMYEIDSHALSTAESGSTGKEGCDMTIRPEHPCSCTAMVGYLEEMVIYVCCIQQHIKETASL